MSPDMKKLCWRNMMGRDKFKICTVLFKEFSTVYVHSGDPYDDNNNSCTIYLMGVHGTKNYTFEYANGLSIADNEKAASEWADAFNFLIHKA